MTEGGESVNVRKWDLRCDKERKKGKREFFTADFRQMAADYFTAKLAKNTKVFCFFAFP
jgi:hypothetical protein